MQGSKLYVGNLNYSVTNQQLEELFSSLDSVFDYLFPLGILLAVAFVVIGGYMWMSSAGNPDKIKQAQGTLTWAIIGLIFIVMVGLLLRTIVDYLI